MSRTRWRVLSPPVPQTAAREVGERGDTPSRSDGLTTSATHAFAASVLVVATALVTNVILARMLGPAEKGVYDLSLATGSLLALALGLALPAAITVLVARGRVSPARMAWTIPFVGVAQLGLGGGLLLIIGAIGLGSLFLPSGASAAMFSLVALLGALGAASSSLRAVVVGRGLIARASWIAAGERVLAMLVIAGAGLALSTNGAGSRTAEPFLSLTATTAGVGALAYWVAARRRSPTDPGLPFWGEALRLAIPSYGANLLQFFNYRLDLFLVAALRSPTEVGIYALAAAIAQLVWLSSGALSTALLPRVAADSSSAAPASARLARLSILAAVTSAVGIIALSPLLGLIYGEAFEPALAPIALLLPGTVVFSTVNVLAAYFAGVGRPQVNLCVSGLTLLITVVLDLLLIPAWGMSGAALASSASYGCAAVLTALVFLRSTGASLRQIAWPTRDELRQLATMSRSRPRSPLSR